MKNSIRKIATLSIIGLVLFAQQNCNKDGVGGPQTLPSSISLDDAACKLLTAITQKIGSPSSKDVVTYLSDGRVNTYTKNDTTKYTYSYPNSTNIIVKSKSTIDSFLVNSAGLVSKSSDGFFPYFYTYDESGYLLKYEATTPFFTLLTTYTWKNGNLITTEQNMTPKTGNPNNMKFEFTYNSNINNSNLSFFGPGNDGESIISTKYFGRRSTNLASSIKFTQFDGQKTTIQTISFDYTFDANNNSPIKIVATSDKGEVSTLTLTYKCN